MISVPMKVKIKGEGRYHSIISIRLHDFSFLLECKLKKHYLYSETPEQQHCAGQVIWPLLRVWLLSEVINTYLYVSHSMPLDCCREFGLSSGGLCSGVSLYYSIIFLVCGSCILF